MPLNKEMCYPWSHTVIGVKRHHQLLSLFSLLHHFYFCRLLSSVFLCSLAHHFFLWPLQFHPARCVFLLKKQYFLFALLLCLLSLFGHFPLLLTPLSLFALFLSLAGWNCGRGQLGLCRWPSSLPWWCSALTRCLLAAVTTGNRQVHGVLPRGPPFQHHERLITLSLRGCNTCSLSLSLTESSPSCRKGPSGDNSLCPSLWHSVI